MVPRSVDSVPYVGTGCVNPRTLREGALVGLVVAEVAWLATDARVVGVGRWAVLAALVVGHLALVRAERRDPSLSWSAVLLAVIAVVIGAVAVGPVDSRDLYQYAMYGRIVTFHHASPYVVAPDHFAGDPFLEQLASGWRGARSVYGPAFTALSAVLARAFGRSPLLARLCFQGLAGVSLVAVVVHLRRRAVAPWLGLFVGVSPVMVAAVNGGHNDVLVGALVLLGVDLARRSRPARAALVLALACCVKVLALPVVAALAVAGWRSGDRRGAVRVGAGTLALIAVGYAVAGGRAALEPLGSWGHNPSRASLWSVVAVHGGSSATIGHTGIAVARGALLVTVLLAGVAWARWSGGPPDAISLALVLGTIALAFGDYVLPWYAATYLPLAALAASRRARAGVGAVSVVLLVAYARHPGSGAPPLPGSPTVARLAGLCLVMIGAWSAWGAGEARSAVGAELDEVGVGVTDVEPAALAAGTEQVGGAAGDIEAP